MGNGRLYVCATPIGNLEDVTLRVLRVLKEADLIAAEDTRHTRQLLDRYDIATPMLSLHEHNEARRTAQLLDRLAAGETVALVSDAGTPGISDPGERLIRAVIAADVPLTVLPGPTAFVTALVGSGLSTERFAFEGFLPRSPGRRRKALRALAREERTLIFYEAPHRVRSTLKDMEQELGDRPACVARELTKTFEQWQRGSLRELAETWAEATPRGEFVIVVAGAEGPAEGAAVDEPTEEVLTRRVREAMAASADKRDAIRQVAKQLGVPQRTVYRAAIGIDPRVEEGG